MCYLANKVMQVLFYTYLSQFLTKRLCVVTRSAPSLSYDQERGLTPTFLKEGIEWTSWGNSPDVKIESIIRKRNPARENGCSCDDGHFLWKWQELLETAPSNSRRLSKVILFKTQRGLMQLLVKNSPLCAWPCLVVGLGFKPRGA